MAQTEIINKESHFNTTDHKKTSKNILTKYEKTSIIGVRIEQLAYGAPSTLNKEDLKQCKDIREIANKELQTRTIPFIICRNLPNNTKEYWDIEDFIIL